MLYLARLAMPVVLLQTGRPTVDLLLLLGDVAVALVVLAHRLHRRQSNSILHTCTRFRSE